MTHDVADGAGEARQQIARLAFRTLRYNQDLVQFADSKAGTLIVINSLFVASTQAVSLQDPLARGLHAAYVIAAAAAVMLCLRVVMTRPPKLHPRRRKDLVFFGDIASRRDAATYAREFQEAPPSRLADDLLSRAYAVAGIAQRKFRSYGAAQGATALSGSLWLVAHVTTALGGA